MHPSTACHSHLPCCHQKHHRAHELHLQRQFSAHKLIILRRHSPMPIGRTPAHLSSAINLPETSACTFDHGKIWLHFFVARVETSSLKCKLWAPWRNKTICQCSESVPEAPELPCKERVVFSMEAELIITSSMSGKTGTCNREERCDLCGSGCFDFKVS